MAKREKEKKKKREYNVQCDFKEDIDDFCLIDLICERRKPGEQKTNVWNIVEE